MKYLKIFILSILLFSTFSFLSIFDDLAQSLYRNNAPNLSLGYPLTYYKLFFVEHTDFNYEWNRNFIVDYLFALVLSIGIYYLNEYLKKINKNEFKKLWKKH